MFVHIVCRSGDFINPLAVPTYGHFKMAEACYRKMSMVNVKNPIWHIIPWASGFCPFFPERPYGWEPVDKYYANPSSLENDIEDGSFKEYLENKLGYIMDSISKTTYQ